MLRKLMVMMGAALMFVAPAMADWNPEDPAKWFQMPDLSTMGIDVNATAQMVAPGYILADDFLCTMTGPITGIHIWGSWINDYIPFMDAPEAVLFRLSIHRDIPASQSPTGYSMPGDLLWYREFQPGEFMARVYAGNIVEGWMDPPDMYIFPADWTCWQYNFNIPEEEAFHQQEGTIYWLDVQAVPQDPEARFGWKTSIDHWNDNAVWVQGVEPYVGIWFELWYPPAHELHDQQIDLAFVMVTKEEHEREACCMPDGTCVDGMLPIDCMNMGGTPQGPGTLCGGFQEACCLPDGTCLDVDPLCCDDMGGVLQGPGTMCSAPEGCCLSDGTCTDVDPLCCDELGGIPQGAGTLCSQPEGCCLPDGTCIDIDPLCCDELGGLSQGPGTICTGVTQACCDPADGTLCADVEALCCDDIGGWVGLAPVCLGDGNGNGTDDACEDITLEPKWDQPPHGPGEGFDAASDLWLRPEQHSIKWEQLPDPQGIAYHAHDYNPDPDTMRLILANDWRCDGGVVTDFHWWGTFEGMGSGLKGFHLSIHDNDPGPCLPLEPSIWEADVPMAQITMTATGMTNGAGELIYRFDYYLPVPFAQTEGNRYWFDVCALSIDPGNPCLWKWQVTNPILLCASAYKTVPAVPPGMPGDWTSFQDLDLAFRVTSEEEPQETLPNKVVADDFISDGRTIDAVRWWGSYFDDRYYPYEPVEPYMVDGWIISFHHADPNFQVNPTCPPDLLAGDSHPTVLGLYFAPVDAVEIVSTGYFDCLGHEVFEYFVDLPRCCLLCAETDPRDGLIPAEPEAFHEIANFGYWLDIQAVTGAEWRLPDCQMAYTGHIPPDDIADPHFWGWHTSYRHQLNEACTGKIVDFGPYPPGCWDYGDWVKQPWLCPDMQLVDMSFQLLTWEDLPAVSPVFTSINSVSDHGTLEKIPVPWIGGMTDSRRISVSGRADPTIDVNFDKPMAAGSEIMGIVPPIAGAIATANGTPTVVISFPGSLPLDDTAYVFDLAGSMAVDGGVFGSTGEDTNFCVTYLEADCDGSTIVGGLDVAAISANWGAAASSSLAAARADVDRSGIVAGLDAAAVSANWGNAAACPP